MTPLQRALAVLATAIVLALTACQRAAPPATTTAPPPATAASPSASSAVASTKAEEPKPADKNHPTLRITTFEGKPYDLASERGHWVVVNFWATWCGPCLEEMPDLTAFVKRRKDVAVIGLDFEEIEKPELEAFLKKHTPGYPIALIDTYHPPLDFDIPRALPTSYLIAPDGSVAYKHLGPITVKELEQQIDKSKPAG